MNKVKKQKVGFGGGCHWCTEGVFSSLIGVDKVNQGWISSIGKHSNLSEAIEVVFDSSVISLAILIEIHLHTHASTSNHSMREKYRSAVYTYTDAQHEEVKSILENLQEDFGKKIITTAYPFQEFKENKAEFQNYLYKSPNNIFCKNYIYPKLQLLLSNYTRQVNHEKLSAAKILI